MTAYGTFQLTMTVDTAATTQADAWVTITPIPHPLVDDDGDVIFDELRDYHFLGSAAVHLPSDAPVGSSSFIGYRVRVRTVRSSATTIVDTTFYAPAIGSTIDLTDVTPAVVETVPPSEAAIQEAKDAAAEATAAAADAQASADAAAATLASAVPKGSVVFNVKDYGAVGNGTTNDLPAFQATHDALPATGGVIWVPPGDYNLIGTTASGGGKVGVVIWKDNVTVDGPGRTVQASATTPVQRQWIVVGGGKTSHTDPVNPLYRDIYQPTYPIAPAAVGAATLTLTNPPDGTRFAVGDDIYIRTGSLVTGSPNITPDAEYNIVSGVNTSTGVITLRWPTLKAYAQEYYKAATPGSGPYADSDTTDHGFGPAPLVVSNVTATTVRNFHLNIDCSADPGSDYILYIDGATNVTMEGRRVKGFGFGVAGGRSFRGFRFNRNIVSRPAGGATTGNWFAPSTGCSNGQINNNVLEGEQPRKFHAHEGITDLEMAGNIIRTTSAAAGSAIAQFSSRGRAYRHKIRNNTLIGNFTDTGAYVLKSSGGNTVGCEFTGNHLVTTPAAGYFVSVAAGDQWRIEHNTFPTGTTSTKFDDQSAGSTRWANNLNSPLDPVPDTGPIVVYATDHADGLSNATPYLNGLIATASAAPRGGRVVLTGVYRIDSSLIAQSNVTLEFLDATAWLQKNYTDNGTPGFSLVRNNDFTTKVNNFRITGPGRIGSDNFATMKGNIVCIYGDDLVLTGFRVDGWSAGRAVSGVGDRWRIDRLKIINCTGLPGDGGIRIMGGVDGVCSNTHIESGDDAFQLVPGGSGSTTNPNFFSQTIRRWTYLGGTGFSTQGRFMVVALQNRDALNVMTASITDCSFIGMHGIGGSHLGFFIQNYNSTGDIDGIDYLGCTTQAGGTSASSVEGMIARYPQVLASVGRIRRITLQGHRMRGPRKTSLLTSGGVEHLSLIDCHFEKPNATTVPNVAVTSGSATVVAPALVDPDGNPLAPPFGDVDIGAPISGAGIPINTQVSTVSDDGLTITMNKTATADGTVTVTVGGTTTIDLTGSVHTRIVGGSVQGGGNGHVIQAGAADRTYPNGATINNATIDLAMRDVTIYDIPDNTAVSYALNMNRVIGAKIDHCTFLPVTGGTTGRGIRVSSLSSKVKLSDNDLTAVPSATKILDQATDTKRTDNLGADTAAVGIPATDVQVFATPGSFTWTKPAGAVRVQVEAIAGGGGGGSGRRGLTSTIRCGGGGGSGGLRTFATIAAVELGVSETLVVGVGGAGGLGVTVDSTDGNVGSNGGQSLFGGVTTTRVVNSGAGIAGGGGTATTGAGGAATAPGTAAGASASTTGGVGVGSATLQKGTPITGAGGGSGGGITSGNLDSAGGSGQIGFSGNTGAVAAAGTAGGGAGGAGQPSRTNSYLPGGAGAGGGGSSTSAGGAGGVGGLYGAGGGGGGASLNGFASGAGGAGASGVVVVTTYFQ